MMPNLVPRASCRHCGLHPNICVCDACAPVANRTPITILQHPTEVGRPKGTVRILQRCLEQLTVVPGETADDFRAGEVDLAALPSGTAVLFPGPDSQPLETVDVGAINHWLVLDGTWRKAAKLLHLNPSLAQLPRFHFATPPVSRYVIRKAPGAGALSTAEAVTYLLEQIEPALDTRPLNQAMAALVERLLAQVPPSLRERYEHDRSG